MVHLFKEVQGSVGAYVLMESVPFFFFFFLAYGFIEHSVMI